MSKISLINRNVTAIQNVILNDSDIGLTAIGILCKVLSIRDDETFSLNDLYGSTPSTKRQVALGISRLKRFDYAKSVKVFSEKDKTYKDTLLMFFDDKELCRKYPNKVSKESL